MKPTEWSLRVQRALAVAAAAAAVVACLHALLTPFTPATVLEGVPRLSIGVLIAHVTHDDPPLVHAAARALLALFGVIAGVLGVVLARSAPRVAAARQLMCALGFGSFAFAWFTFVNTHPWVVHIDQGSLAGATLLDATVWALGGYAAAMLMRFFIWFPRPLTLELWVVHSGASGPAARSRQGQSTFTRVLAGLGKAAMKLLRNDEETSYRVLTSRHIGTLLAILCAVSVVLWYHLVNPASMRAFAESGLPISVAFATAGLFFWCFAPPFILIMGAADIAQLQYRHGGEAERRQIEWIYRPPVAVIVLFAASAAIFLIWAALAAGSGNGRFVARVLMGLCAFLAIAVSIALLAGLGIAIFYRGAIDPGLAVRKAWAWSLLALLLTFLFLVGERLIAATVVSALGWSPDTGGVLAGALVTMSFTPLRRYSEAGIAALAQRWRQPHGNEGERVQRTVAFVDISGYSSVSAADEARALMLASILQRQARLVAQRCSGRVVKSLGDAVLLEFESAASAVEATAQLRHVFSTTCDAAGVEPLPLHAGLHTGEVVRMADGDLFGPVVNLAARLQDFAREGQIVVSAAVREAFPQPGAHWRELGARTFKNIPQPVSCYEWLGVAAEQITPPPRQTSPSYSTAD